MFDDTFVFHPATQRWQRDEVLTVDYAPRTAHNYRLKPGWVAVEVTIQFHQPKPKLFRAIEEWCSENVGEHLIKRPARPDNRLMHGSLLYCFSNSQDAGRFAVWLKLMTS